MADDPPDPYVVLGVAKDATPSQLRSAHRKLLLKYHPDKIQDTALKAVKANEFQRVQQAYELLSDDARRLQYDEQVLLRDLRAEIEKSRDPVVRSSPFQYSVHTAVPMYNEQAYDEFRAARREPGSSRDNDQRRKLLEREEKAWVKLRMKLEKEAARTRKREKKLRHQEKDRLRRDDEKKSGRSTYVKDDDWEDDHRIARSKKYRSNIIEPELETNRNRPSLQTHASAPPLIYRASCRTPTREVSDIQSAAGDLMGGGGGGRGVRETRGSSRLRKVATNSDSNIGTSYYPSSGPQRHEAEPVRYVIESGHTVPVYQSRYTNSENDVRYAVPSPTYEPTRWSTQSTSERPTLKRVTSSTSMDDSTKKMHYSMGSDYVTSGDERTSRSRRTYGSREKSRHRSHSRNRRHSDAYAPPNLREFVDVSDILTSHSSKPQRSDQALLDRQRADSVEIQRPLHLNCPNCSESFSDLRLILQHHEEKHIMSSQLHNGKRESPDTTTSPIAQAMESMDAKLLNGQEEAEEFKCTAPITDTEPDAKAAPERMSSSRTAPLQATTIKKQKAIHLPRKVLAYLVEVTLSFLGLQTTAWFILVVATAVTAVTTTYSLQGSAPDPPPVTGDSNYYSSLSQSIIAICSLYYMMVPFLRGDDALPVRGLFYVCWFLGLVGAIACPLIYGRDWTKSIWCGFGSALAQVAASAFLFEHSGMKEMERERHKKKVGIHRKEAPETHEEAEILAKYTDELEEDK